MKQVGTLLLASALLVGASVGSALALDKVSGTIKSIDPQNRELTLDSGKSFEIARNVTLEGLKPGDKVTVSTETANGKTIASGIEQTGLGETRAGGTVLGK